MLGIHLGVAQQRINEKLTLARIVVIEESLKLSWGGWEAPEIEIGAARK